MRRTSRTAAAFLLLALGLSWSSDAEAAPPPEVYSIIEGRDTQTDQPTVVLIGKRVKSYRTWALQFPDGSDAGTPERIFKSAAMCVFRLPQGTVAGTYDLVLTYGRRSPTTQTHRIVLTNGGVLPGSVVQTDLTQVLADDLADAETLGGYLPDYFLDAGSLATGTLSTDRFSAYEDLQIEARIGDDAAQVARGDHEHDAAYPTRGELADPGTVNDTDNPVDWTKLKSVPAGVEDGDDDTTYTAGTGLLLTDTEFSVDGVPWSKLADIPADIADGDADTTYTAGDNVKLTAGAIGVPSFPWSDLTGVPAGLDDGDDDTTYTAGANVTLKGTEFSVPTFRWLDLTGVPAGLDDGDDDTQYTAGANVVLKDTQFSVVAFPWSGLTSVPAGLDDGDDDTTYKAGTHVDLTDNVFSVPTFPWNRLTGVPSGIADGDDDTTYTAGTGLQLKLTEFSVKDVPWSSLTGIPAGFADGIDDGALWSESGGNVYRSSGRVGVGTSAPRAELDVRGIDGVLFGGTLDSGTIPVTGAGTRCMWYPRKAALRAGRVGRVAAAATNWDDKQVGLYSTAFGVDTRASGVGATAAGSTTTASGESALAMGSGTTATGDRSTALGFGSTASGTDSTALGSSTTASGLAATATGSGTTAAGDYATALGFRSTGWAWGSVAIGRYNTLTGSKTAWLDSDPLFVVGNGTATSDRADAFTIFKDAGLLAAGTYESDASGKRTIPTTGEGVRMMWYPEKAAFRAGGILAFVDPNGSTAHWDDANVGVYSCAFGRNTTASGLFSTALGTNTTASASGGSVSMGQGTIASGSGSVAMGLYSEAIGDRSLAAGRSTKAQAYCSVALGRYNWVGSGEASDSWVSTDPVLVVGKGSSNASRSNALVLRKNGNLTIAGTLTENSDARLKKDVEPLGPVLRKIAGIRGVTYRFKDEDKGPAGQHIGLVAQEVRKAFPELVTETADGTLSVAYGKFTAVLLEAVKEQQARIEALEKELKETREDHGARLARLEALFEGGSK